MFCPNCKRLMRPDAPAKVWRCASCGKTVPLGRAQEVGKVEATARSVSVIEEGAGATLPTTDEECPKCGNMKAYWVLRQTRGADEPETRILECTKCGHKWREYQ